MKTHRLAYTLTIESLGELCVLHKCDNPGCCNPGHLFLGTQADNVRDMEEKGRTRRQKGETNGQAKLTATNVREIRRRCASGKAQQVIANAFGISNQTVSDICTGHSWASVSGSLTRRRHPQ